MPRAECLIVFMLYLGSHVLVYALCSVCHLDVVKHRPGWLAMEKPHGLPMWGSFDGSACLPLTLSGRQSLEHP